MRIPLNLGEDKLRISVSLILNLENRAFLGAIFYVDTGSQYTLIDEVYTKNRRILTQNLELDSETGLGGTNIKLFKLKSPSKFRFRVGDSLSNSFPLNCLRVAKNPEDKNAMYTGINLIGMDFLKEMGATLFVDSANNTAYFELKE